MIEVFLHRLPRVEAVHGVSGVVVDGELSVRRNPDMQTAVVIFPVDDPVSYSAAWDGFCLMTHAMQRVVGICIDGTAPSLECVIPVYRDSWWVDCELGKMIFDAGGLDVEHQFRRHCHCYYYWSDVNSVDCAPVARAVPIETRYPVQPRVSGPSLTDVLASELRVEQALVADLRRELDDACKLAELKDKQISAQSKALDATDMRVVDLTSKFQAVAMDNATLTSKQREQVVGVLAMARDLGVLTAGRDGSVA